MGLGLRTEGEGEKEVEREGKGEEQAEGGRGGAWSAISTLDESLDEVLGGGILTGYITEITGERYALFFVSLSLLRNLLRPSMC